MIRVIVTGMMLAFGGSVLAEQSIKVYQLDGSVQCEQGEVATPSQATETLQQVGIKVLSSESVQVPFSVPRACGTPTGKAIVLEVDGADWSKATRKRTDGYGFGVWVFDRPEVEVYKYDGSLQCGRGKEIPLEVMARQLTDAGIEVKATRKGNDGRLHIAMCGASTGSLNVFTIDTGALGKARELGFELLVTRQLSQAIGGPAKVGLRGPALMRSPPRDPGDAKRQPIPKLW